MRKIPMIMNSVYINENKAKNSGLKRMDVNGKTYI